MDSLTILRAFWIVNKSEFLSIFSTSLNVLDFIELIFLSFSQLSKEFKLVFSSRNLLYSLTLISFFLLIEAYAATKPIIEAPAKKLIPPKTNNFAFLPLDFYTP